MKKLLVIFILSAAIFASCEKAVVQEYSRKNAVYFQLYPTYSNLSDTLNYTFVKNTLPETAIMIRVNLQGVPENRDRKFTLKVDTENSTAVEGADFRPLDPYYVIAANEFHTEVPIYIKRTEFLKTGNRILTLRIEETEDLEPGLSNRLKAVIKFTDRITKPIYWDDGPHYHFGTAWSQVKQLKIEEIAGWEFPETRDEYRQEPFYTRAAAWGFHINKWFGENPTYDENNNLILPWK